jgi:hypothetical protein
MSLITINADFSRVADALERIAKAVEDAVYEPQAAKPARPADLNDYSRVTDEEIIARQREEERRIFAYGSTSDADQDSSTPEAVQDQG